MKRWSRLKQAVDKGEVPGASAYQFLWLCLKHSTRDKVSTSVHISSSFDFLSPSRADMLANFSNKLLTQTQAMDWAAIADVCNTTKGAASKRYSRLKLAFERGDGPPVSSVNGSTPKSTPKKATTKKATNKDESTISPESAPKSTFRKIAPKPTSWTPINAPSEDLETPAPSAPKRKRAAPKKKVNEETIKTEAEEDEDASEEKPSKRPRARVSKKKTLMEDEVVDEALTPGTDGQSATLSTPPRPEDGHVIKDERVESVEGVEDDGGFSNDHDYLQSECKFSHLRRREGLLTRF
jgi:hypothetical protein